MPISSVAPPGRRTPGSAGAGSDQSATPPVPFVASNFFATGFQACNLVQNLVICLSAISAKRIFCLPTYLVVDRLAESREHSRQILGSRYSVLAALIEFARAGPNQLIDPPSKRIPLEVVRCVSVLF